MTNGPGAKPVPLAPPSPALTAKLCLQSDQGAFL